jgi:isopenicillin N synthase-like dioxygenase
MRDKIGKAVTGLMSDGYALLDLGDDLSSSVSTIFDDARLFFRQPINSKLAMQDKDSIEGYLHFGVEFSELAERPDLCEGFAVWGRNANLPRINLWAHDLPIHQSMSRTLPLIREIADKVLANLYGKVAESGTIVEASDASYLQVNYYKPSTEARDLLQDAHEDGHLLTFLVPTSEGIEIKTGATFAKVRVPLGSCLIMPGSVMTVLTGGLIEPLFHRVANDRTSRERLSLMFFVNPNLETETESWIKSRLYANTSVREQAIKMSSSFGLPSIDKWIE